MTQFLELSIRTFAGKAVAYVSHTSITPRNGLFVLLLIVMFGVWGIETIMMLRSKAATETNGIPANALPAQPKSILKRAA